MVLTSLETRKESVGISSVRISYVILTCLFNFLNCKSGLQVPLSCEFRWTCCAGNWWQMGTGAYWNNICHEETALRVEKPAPVPFCVIEIPFGILWDGNRNFTFKSRWRISQWLLCDTNFSTTYFHVHRLTYCNMCFNTRTSMTRV
jgi:hypothetical protein